MVMIIHLIAPKIKDKWHPIWKKCYEIWLSSPYEIRLWEDKEIDSILKEDDIKFYNKLSECPNIYKYDYVRYLILEKYGGAYFDMDMEVKRDFITQLKPNRLYFSEGPSRMGIESSIMIHTGGQNVFLIGLKNACQRVINSDWRENTVENTLWKTGPMFLTSYVMNYYHEHEVRKGDIQILPWELFSSKHNDLSYCIHHYTNSWH